MFSRNEQTLCLQEKSSTIQSLQIQMQQVSMQVPSAAGSLRRNSRLTSIQQNSSLSGDEEEVQELKKKLLEAESEAAAAKEELSSSREGVEKLQELLQVRSSPLATPGGEGGERSGGV